MTCCRLSLIRPGGSGPVIYLEGGRSMLHAGARTFSDPWQHGFGWWLTIKLRGRYLVMHHGGPANQVFR